MDRNICIYAGKSAIVAAIQLCLGSKTRVTGRGSNLSSLIREGTDGPAVIQVTLSNEGADSFKSEQYGNRIIVERKWSRTGSSQYRLCSHSGAV